MAVALIVGLVISNYAYQYFTGSENWGLATDRAFHQGVAVVAYWGFLKLREVL
jgi:hypothetical protein